MRHYISNKLLENQQKESLHNFELNELNRIPFPHLAQIQIHEKQWGLQILLGDLARICQMRSPNYLYQSLQFVVQYGLYFTYVFNNVNEITHPRRNDQIHGSNHFFIIIEPTIILIIGFQDFHNSKRHIKNLMALEICNHLQFHSA